MIVIVNGEEKLITEGTKIRHFTEELKGHDRALVTELNGLIVTDEDTVLSGGDSLEIVTFVGGG
ncbi:sulfur carrier protein ThiS [Myxococcota bacterium]|nr:sulfur carrier protein ThiS [Myxococcota bacterium]MBU1379741.1 sulfur carrier protein ThiS [Myxococcota bacterium]MBU1498546.1 sulfur carrier protein ThiS [Myxococcota bacterium]